MKLQSILAGVVGIASIASQVAALPLTRRDLLKPSQDPFYTPPSGYESANPGAILRSRDIKYQHNVQGAYQLLYRTEDVLGRPSATVATILRPYNANTSTLVTYQYAEDSPNIDCAPSYSLQQNSTSVDTLFIETLLNRGYYVMASDYEGPNSTFTCGGTSGKGVLDGLRAALASTSVTGLDANANVQLWGYSGGALASGWAVQMQKSYAPELKVIGAALGGTPVNLNASFAILNGKTGTGLIPASFIGLTQQYDDLREYLFSVIKPEYQELWHNVSNQCLSQIEAEFGGKDMSMYFNRTDYLNAEPARKAISDNEMGHMGAPSIPLHMYHAIHDEVVPYSPAQGLVQSWCASGANINFISDELSEHLILAFTGAADAVTFLVGQFKGTPQAPGCSKRTTLTSALDSGALAVFGETIFDQLKNLFNAEIGPNKHI
ncbi:secretory lipase-domain-containing protein [Gongronella butleri]|nr:secretory lipase-domain-containing protein [Gongronella butleri]